MANHPRKTNDAGEFFCPRCKEFLSISNFDVSKRTYYGITTWCRKCCTAQRIKWHSNPRAHLLDLMNKAKKRGREFTLPDAWTIAQFERQNGLCYYTGIQMTTGHGNGRVWSNASIDRRDSSLGYTEDNCVLCCTGFNLMKTNLSLPDMKLMCQAFIRNSKD